VLLRYIFGEVQSGAGFGLTPARRHRGLGFIQRKEIRQY